MLLVFLATAVACIDPADLGAKPDDGASDTAALQAAVDKAAATGGDVCVGVGVWNIERTDKVGSLVIARPVTIYGKGPSTVLRMTGDGRQRDWRMIQIKGAGNVVLRDVAVDGIAATNTEEQTHLVEIDAGAHDITIARVVFGPMRTAQQTVGEGIGGDCLRLAGEADDPVRDVLVIDSTFTDCDRSAIAFQRAVAGAAIIRASISGTGNTDIDFEPTGKGEVEDIFLLELQISRSPQAKGTWAISIGGHGTGIAARRVVLARSTMNGGVGIVAAADVDIINNKIKHGPKGAPTILLRRHADRVRIRKNVIERGADATAAPLIDASHHGEQMPHDVTITDNELVQDTDAPLIELASTSQVVIERNHMRHVGSTRMPAVLIDAGISDPKHVLIEDNEIEGSLPAVLRLNARKRAIQDVRVLHNKSKSRMIDCDGARSSFRSVRASSLDGVEETCGAPLAKPAD